MATMLLAPRSAGCPCCWKPTPERKRMLRRRERQAVAREVSRELAAR